jgi:hypothetical protein
MVESKRLIGNQQAQPSCKVHDYFERGLYRSRAHLPPRRGEIVRGEERLLAQFFIDVKDGRIQYASYKCSTCVVLVAYCERLAEMVRGRSLQAAVGIAASTLVRAFLEVPSHRHERASLAIRALHAAIYHPIREV